MLDGANSVLLMRAEIPRNLDAEQALLGALLQDGTLYDRVTPILCANDFSDPANGLIYQAIVDRREAGQAADAIGLRPIFITPPLDALGPKYLVRLLNSVITAVNIEDYAETIADCARRARLIGTCEDAIARAKGGWTPDRTAETLVEELAGRIDRMEGRGEAQAIGDLLPGVVAQMERAWRGETTAIPTGFLDLDHRLGGGLEPGQLAILAARPGMGKTSLALGIAERMAKAGRAVLFASLEMGRFELGRRMLAPRLDLGPNAIKRPDPQDTTIIGDALKAQQEIGDLPLAIDDAPAQTQAHIRAAARALRKARGRLDCVIVDHLGRMKATPDAERRGRYEKITDISSGLKVLAKELMCPVIALCQLSRAIEARDDKRPNLADLRDSGSIEEDADVVMFLYRESYYLRDDIKQREGERPGDYADRQQERSEARIRAQGVADLILAKMRDGEPGTVGLSFQERTASFDNLGRGA